jgi:nicotinate phosphoribosyltransferase
VTPLPRRAELGHGILFTDVYELTMAQLYLRLGLHDRPAHFEHFFRSYPDYGTHQAGYCIAAGLAWLVDWMRSTRATPVELDVLRGYRTATGGLLFGEDFLSWLATDATFDRVRLSATPEGRVVHPNVPITVVEGPLAIAQLLESALLNQLNFQTLIATKASRVVDAGRGQPVLEFGLRRAPDAGANAASRAALVGGARFTSNTAAAALVGLPAKGTHAHSMVQVFDALGDGERGAFEAFADVYPDDCVLLVDTIDTLESGVPNAIRVFERLRRAGHRPVGIRLDSGDLAFLSIQAAAMLDAAGFPDTTITLSSQLDELAMWQILAQIEEEAPRYGVDADRLIGRLVYGVGSRLATSHGDPSLDGVYKLVAIEDAGQWTPAIKVSDTAEKTLNPGVKRIWRTYDERRRATADVLALAEEDLAAPGPLELHHHARSGVSRVLTEAQRSRTEQLLVPVLDGGQVVVDGGRDALHDLDAARQRRQDDLAALDPGVRRLVNPHVYHVSVTTRLRRLRDDLVREARHLAAG